MDVITFFHQGHRAMPKTRAQAIPSQEVSPPEFPVFPLPYWEHPAFTLTPQPALNQKLSSKPLQAQPPAPSLAQHTFCSKHQAAPTRQVGREKGPCYTLFYQTSAMPQPAQAWLPAVAGSDDGWDHPAASNAQPVPTAACWRHKAPSGSLFTVSIKGMQSEGCKSTVFPWSIVSKQ